MSNISEIILSITSLPPAFFTIVFLILLSSMLFIKNLANSIVMKHLVFEHKKLLEIQNFLQERNNQLFNKNISLIEEYYNINTTPDESSK